MESYLRQYGPQTRNVFTRQGRSRIGHVAELAQVMTFQVRLQQDRQHGWHDREGGHAFRKPSS